jgi:ribose/xylose/arabinose/galactoside ABC-type transport system permease subunit
LSEFLYGYSSVAIALVLFVALSVANEAGYRAGRRRIAAEGAKAQTNAIQAAMLGLLALLLGFTFMMAVQRFDSRSEAVINEANAIGTAYLRVQLLPDVVQADARALFARYVELRIQASAVDLSRQADRRTASAAANGIQEQMWSVAVRASEIDPRPTTTGLFIQALNEVFDAYAQRDAALKKHVPEVVLLVLFAVFIIAGAVLGYASGISGARPTLATLAMSVLIVLVIFIIIDLDRPRRGLIRVNQEGMHDLAATVAEER